MADTENTPTWRVTHQEEEHGYDGQGNPNSVMHVHFATKSGTASHVTIPAKDYTPEKVAQAIHHKAQKIEHVAALTSDHTVA